MFNQRVWMTLMACAAVSCCRALAADPASENTPGPSTSENSSAPRPIYWELVFDESVTAQLYAEQLDFFQIELAALAKDDKLEYASHLGQRRPERRVATLAEDPRLRIAWQKGSMEAIDRRLLTRAGINTKGKQIWHFFPDSLRKQMAQLERAYAKREPAEIKRTRFGIRAAETDGQYEMFVLEQDPPRRGSPEPPARSRNQPAANNQTR